MVPSTQPDVHARERIRVLFVLGSLAGGGAERIVSHLVRHLDRRVFDARIGLLWRHGPYLTDLADEDLVVPRYFQGWIPYRDRPPWWHLVPALALVPFQQYEVVRRFRPHVVVTATKSMNLAARLSLAAFGRSRTAWIAREGNNTAAMIASDGGRPLAALQQVVVGGAYRSADAVVAISHGVAGALANQFGLDPTRVHEIPNAVDLDRVRSLAGETAALPASGRFIVAAGRLDRQKGFDVLLHAHAAGLARRGVSLVILGEGRERRALEELARDLNIAPSVQFPGFVNNPWAYFARAAAFVCPSRWEGFGNVIVEAMACGAPVVVSDCDFGPREIVQHGTSGLLVPVNDSEALASAVGTILDDAELGARLAGGAHRRAGDFGLPRMTEAYARLFRELTTGR